MSLDPRIQHVVVLMLENRSFDHMMGYLKESNPAIEGITDAHPPSNRLDCSDPASPLVPTSKTAAYVDPVDAGHDVGDVNLQLFCKAPPGPQPQNSGFINSYREQLVKANADPGQASRIMACFDPAKLPVLSALAREFAVCDHWFCSVPGPTWPNRFFVHAATSDGVAAMGLQYYLRSYPMRTIYDNLREAGVAWRIYFHDMPQSLALNHMRQPGFINTYRLFDRFQGDVQSGNLPPYTFIEPRYFNLLWNKANDDHPPHDVQRGETLIADVYKALRNSALWPGVLLLVLYDEHGGYYDHVPPPAAVNPDGKVSIDPPFDFLRAGPRVPAVLVSPYIQAGTVDPTPYEHASVPSTLKELFGLPNFLTQRDRNASPLDLGLLGDEMRPSPTQLPRPGLAPGALASLRVSAASTEEITHAMATGEVSTEPVSELQNSLLVLANSLNPDPQIRVLAAARRIEHEHDAAVQVQREVQGFFGRAGVDLG